MNRKERRAQARKLRSSPAGAAAAPASPEVQALFNEAVRRHQQGRLPEAEQLYRRILAQEPRYSPALHMLGLVGHAMRNNAAALELIDAAIRLDAGVADYHANRGVCLGELGRADEALAAYDTAIRLRPSHADAHYNRGVCLQQLGRLQQAIAAQDAALRVRPDYAEAHSNRGLCLKRLGRADEALAAWDAAIRIRPDFAEAHYNRGVCLNDLGRFDEAVAAYDAALRARPDHAGSHNNRGVSLYNLRRSTEALAAHERALALDPQSAAAHLNRSHVWLRAGDLAAGFAEYRWRWKVGEAARQRPALACPEWAGEALAGKRLLIFAEQGFGDTLQFIRYVPMAAALGAGVTVLAPPPLVRLLRASLPSVRVVERLEGDAAFDYQAATLSLPYGFGTTLETIPATMPYLTADPDHAAAWAARLGALQGRKVGLVWAGAPRSGDDPGAIGIDQRRSLRLAKLAPLATAADVQFVSLQVGEFAAEARSAPDGMRLVDWTAEIGDFADTAALVAALDLVVTVDTAVAHLAGALGKPVWILSRYDGCWRWLADRETSPWYPTARLFHQAAPGAWAPVIERVAAALSAGGSSTALNRKDGENQ